MPGSSKTNSFELWCHLTIWFQILSKFHSQHVRTPLGKWDSKPASGHVPWTQYLETLQKDKSQSLLHQMEVLHCASLGARVYGDHVVYSMTALWNRGWSFETDDNQPMTTINRWQLYNVLKRITMVTDSNDGYGTHRGTWRNCWFKLERLFGRWNR